MIEMKWFFFACFFALCLLVLSIFLYISLKKVAKLRDENLKIVDEEIKEVKRANEDLVETTGRLVANMVDFTLIYLRFLGLKEGSDKESAKLELEVVWKELPRDVQEKLGDIKKHLGFRVTRSDKNRK